MMQCAQRNASRAAAWRRRRVAIARPVRIDFVRNFVFSRVSKKGGNWPSAGIQCLELVDLTSWRRYFADKDALMRASSRRFPHFPQRGNGASTRRRGPARVLTPASTAPFPMKPILRCTRGILPCRFAVYPAATPPLRPAKRVSI